MKNAQTQETIAANGRHPRHRISRAEAPSPAETLAAPAWRLPGGIRLADYALRGGFVASALLTRTERQR